MKKTIKGILNKILPESFYKWFLYKFRKIRFISKSYLFLPHYIYWDKSKISTRGWATANIELWKRRRGFKIYEPETTKCLIELMENSNCFWDVGAQVGYFGILSSQRGIKTYAFEMNNDFCKEIKKHADFNNLNINIIDKPLGRSKQSISFETYAGLVQKKAISADEFIKETGDVPDLIKVDIDGGENDFIKGAKKLLKEYNPEIIMEVRNNKQEASKTIHFMESFGYSKIKCLDVSNIYFKK